MRRSIPLTVIAVFMLLLAACGADEPGPAIDPVPDEPDADAGGEVEDDVDEDMDEANDDVVDDPTSGDAGGAAGSDPMLGPEVQQVIDDASERAGVAEDEVQVTVTELVTWPDGAIGCPEPGMMYTQALVEGYRIVVEAGGTSYTYHGQNGSAPFHCEQPQDPAEVTR